MKNNRNLLPFFAQYNTIYLCVTEFPEKIGYFVTVMMKTAQGA